MRFRFESALAEQEKPVAESHGNAKGTTAHTEAGRRPQGPVSPFQKDTFASQLVSLLVAFVALYLIVSRMRCPRVAACSTSARTRSRAIWRGAKSEGRVRRRAEAYESGTRLRAARARGDRRRDP